MDRKTARDRTARDRDAVVVVGLLGGLAALKWLFGRQLAQPAPVEQVPVQPSVQPAPAVAQVVQVPVQPPVPCVSPVCLPEAYSAVQQQAAQQQPQQQQQAAQQRVAQQQAAQQQLRSGCSSYRVERVGPYRVSKSHPHPVYATFQYVCTDSMSVQYGRVIDVIQSYAPYATNVFPREAVERLGSRTISWETVQGSCVLELVGEDASFWYYEYYCVYDGRRVVM